ncbi:hypothetical protein MAC_04972 [Metarhizium acridum CQMa 102]|uniref:Uncharacterized protein n=1 Tax=Metarhizium acridum (strain CQMa 102) TaxID=655827 RepID=E9E524_METAQ|nr:uncharacterized protein MAC_04972 [Metarhizium acridum CQMa 102]EFY89041.1 hypothetical protein MAC_04972 [Metarhizium acridum CQMa 102]
MRTQRVLHGEGKVSLAYWERVSNSQANTSPYSAGIAWVAGQPAPLVEAKIPLIDQGFSHGDSTYDVISLWNGKIFRLDDHISRLEESCSRIRLQLPLTKRDLIQTLDDMARLSLLQGAHVQIVVTRGT